MDSASTSHQNKTQWHPLPLVRKIFVAFLTLSLLAFGACAASSVDPDQAAAASQASSISNVDSYPVKVYFSKAPVSLTSDFNAVFPVDRISPTIGVATYSLQLLIAGPTLSERDNGYFSELNSIMSGPSVCTTSSVPVGGPDFTLALNKKGTVTENGTATFTFCRATSSSGIGVDARVVAEITATLKQFSTITKVVILNKDGHCFADGSGADACLH